MTEEAVIVAQEEPTIGDKLQDHLNEMNENVINKVVSDVSDDSFKQMVNTVFVNFQKTIDTIRENANKEVDSLLPRVDAKIITPFEKTRLEVALGQLFGIEQIETNTFVLDYLSKNANEIESRYITNLVRIKALEQKVIHKCRQHRIKKDNIATTLDEILKVKVPVFRKKLLTYYSVFLHMLLDNKDIFGNFRHYLVYQLGTIRISAKTYSSTPFVEQVYSIVHNTEMPEIIPFSIDNNNIVDDQFVTDADSINLDEMTEATSNNEMASDIVDSTR